MYYMNSWSVIVKGILKLFSLHLQGYKIYFTTDKNVPLSLWKLVEVPTKATHHFQLSGLTPETVYYIKMAGFTVAGDGPLHEVIQQETRIPGEFIF